MMLKWCHDARALGRGVRCHDNHCPSSDLHGKLAFGPVPGPVSPCGGGGTQGKETVVVGATVRREISGRLSLTCSILEA